MKPATPALYAGAAAEQAALRTLSEHWEQAGFWSLPSVVEALSTYGTELLYLPHPKQEGEWAAACLFRALGQSADLLYIYVLPECRRRGLADGLMSAMLQRLRKNGVERLLLEVRPGNTAAVTFYQSLGMREIARRKNYYQNGDDALIFQFDLC